MEEVDFPVAGEVFKNLKTLKIDFKNLSKSQAFTFLTECAHFKTTETLHVRMNELSDVQFGDGRSIFKKILTSFSKLHSLK